MKKVKLIFIAVLFLAAATFVFSICVAVPPQGSRITTTEIDRMKAEAQTMPTNASNFDYRIGILDGWVHLLLRGGADRNALVQIAPPDFIPSTLGLKKAGRDQEAYTKVDSAIAGLSRIPLPSSSFETTGPNLAATGRPSDNGRPGRPTGEYVDVRFPATQQATAEVHVDFVRPEGMRRYLFGVIGGGDSGNGLSLQDSGFRLVKIIVSRSSTNIPANPEDPAQYDFSAADREIASVINAGGEPMIYFLADRKPADMNKFQAYVKNVARHFASGWGNGQRFPVKIFRFGNEPDSPIFWKDGKEDFYRTYAAWASALKEVNKSFIVGGPGVAMATREKPQDNTFTRLNTFSSGFLEYCRRENVPLDFFSFHAYGPVAYYEFYLQTKTIMEELKKYPSLSPLFGIPRLANDEWDFMMGSPWSGIYHRELDGPEGAAGGVLLLMNMIREGLWMSIKQGGLVSFQKGQSGGGRGLSEFSQGVDIALADSAGIRKPSYYAFKAFNMIGESLGILMTKGTDDHLNFASLAGKTADGVIVVMANCDTGRYLQEFSENSSGDLTYSIARKQFNAYLRDRGASAIPVYNRFRLKVENMPYTNKDKLVYERYVVDANRRLELIERLELPGSPVIDLSREMSVPSVQVVRIHLK